MPVNLNLIFLPINFPHHRPDNFAVTFVVVVAVVVVFVFETSSQVLVVLVLHGFLSGE